MFNFKAFAHRVRCSSCSSEISCLASIQGWRFAAGDAVTRYDPVWFWVYTQSRKHTSRNTGKEQPHTLYTEQFLGPKYLTGCARAEDRPVAVKITSEISAKSE